MKRPHTQACHVSQEEIASFIDGTVGEIDGLRVRVHLQGCEDCREAYRYAVRYRGVHHDVPAADAPSGEALRAARAIAQRDQLGGYGRRGRRRRWAAALSPAGRTALAAAVVAAFAVVAVWLRPVPGGAGFDPHAADVAPVTRAMVTASERNPLVLPGVETDLGPVPAVLRSGPVPITRALDNALSKLAVAYNEGTLTGNEAQWLIAGYLATGQVENARVYVVDARSRYPKDNNVLILDGMLAYSDDELERAAELFEAVLAEDAEDAVAAFNLAVVRYESGAAARARDLFERVRELAPGSPLALRAEAALSEIP